MFKWAGALSAKSESYGECEDRRELFGQRGKGG